MDISVAVQISNIRKFLHSLNFLSLCENCYIDDSIVWLICRQKTSQSYMDGMEVIFRGIILVKFLGKSNLRLFHFFLQVFFLCLLDAFIYYTNFLHCHSFFFSKVHRYRLQCYYTEPGIKQFFICSFGSWSRVVSLSCYFLTNHCHLYTCFSVNYVFNQVL